MNMSNGGGESGKEKETEHDSKKKPEGGGGGASEDYGRIITRMAVAQICENVGFQSFQQSALDTFSVVVIRYLRELGKSAHLYANLAGRTECNVFDIVHGLEDLSLAQGFTGASDVSRCVGASGTVKEIMQFVGMEEEIPFARPLPHFPVVRSRKMTPSFLHSGQETGGEHIPAWLPTFPDSQVYAQFPISSERTTVVDTRLDKIERVKHQRKAKAERSVLSLQKQLGCNGSYGMLVGPVDIVKAKQVAQSNPFLAPPLAYGEKEVSPVVCPIKVLKEPAAHNQDTVMKSSALAIVTEKNGFYNSKDGERKVLPNKRSSVHFKFAAGKKLLGVPHDLSYKNNVGESFPWFGRDDEMKESTEKPEELCQM